MTHPHLPERRPDDPRPTRGASGSLRWVLSPLDYRTHVLVDGDQPVGVVKARCGAVLPVVFPVRDQPSDRSCPPCEAILRVGLRRPKPIRAHTSTVTPHQPLAAREAGVMAASKPAPQQQPRTLMAMHDALVRIRPPRDAPLEQWQAYYHRSAVLYAEIAEIDRGHHHEALYWAERELEKAMLVTGAMKKGATSWNPWTESAHFPQ